MLKDVSVSALKNINTIRHIDIDYERIDNLVDVLISKKDMFFRKSEDVDNIEQYVQLSFVQNAVNYCFWFGEPFRKYVNHSLSGSEALWDVFKHNEKLLDAEYLSVISIGEISSMFGDIPLIFDRQKCLQNTGDILCNKYQGKAINLLEEYNFDCDLLAKAIAEEFDTWNDAYDNIKFYKRIQSFISDVSKCKVLKGKLKNIEFGTLLADYQIPKVFQYYGITKYSDELSSRILKMKIIKPCSREELDIRISTIVLGEVIKGKLINKNIEISAYELDAILWRIGRSINCPHHLCNTIWY